VPNNQKAKAHEGKIDPYKGFWNPQRKTGVATHFFDINYLSIPAKMLASAFFWKKKMGIIHSDFLRIFLCKQKSKHIS